MIGAHTCDERSSKSVIKKEWPDVVFERGFREKDELFKSEWRESDDAHDQRSRKALDGVFGKGEDGEGKSWISLSSHSGAIASLLRGSCHLFYQQHYCFWSLSSEKIKLICENSGRASSFLLRNRSSHSCLDQS